MIHQITVFSDAQQAWASWNLTDFQTRLAYLSTFRAAISGQHHAYASVCQFHLQQAEHALAHPHQLLGPTGETNELYASGRGVTLLLASNSDQTLAAQQSLLAMLTAALLAGNVVLVCSDDSKLNQALESAIKQANLPANVLLVVPFDSYAPLLEQDVRVVGYVGNPATEHNINLQLAKREGAICQLVSETDLSTMQIAHDPLLSLRFITERTRTINITAVGGNATLLELGSDKH